MSLQIESLNSAGAFQKWKNRQLEDMLKRYPKKDGGFDPKYIYAANQLDTMTAKRDGWPCVLVFDWVFTGSGPFITCAVVTLDHFPNFQKLADEFAEQSNIIEQIYKLVTKTA